MGSEHFDTASASCRRYAIGAMTPAAVVCPTSAEQLAEVLRFCAHERLAVVPAGGGSKLWMGDRPERYDVALITTHLAALVDYDPGDLTLVVEAGMRVDALAERVQAEGQFLPLAVPFADRATVGGAVASGLEGPLRQYYGTARDWVLGASFVTGDGRVAHSGGRVVKNVAGYDLHRLLVGSLGTLAVLTRMNLRTYPLPGQTLFLLIRFYRLDNAAAFLRQLRRSPIRFHALDLLTDGWAELLAESLHLDPPTVCVVADFRGSERACARVRQDVEQLASGVQREDITACTGDQARATTLRWQELLQAVWTLHPESLLLRTSLLPTALSDTVAVLEAEAAPLGFRLGVLARATGTTYLLFRPVSPMPASDSFLALWERIRAIFQARGLHGCRLYAPTALQETTTVWVGEASALDVMRALKNAFDPCRILSPGRFVGGI